MDIQFTEEQELLRSSVQRLLRDQYSFDARRKIVASEEGWSRKQWRAFAELGRILPALGGDAVTLNGLAGLGDLALSCTSSQSRNYRHGIALGRGEVPSNDLAEGVFTAPVAMRLAKQAGVDVPLIDAVNLLLSGTISIERIVAGLMSRPLKREN